MLGKQNKLEIEPSGGAWLPDIESEDVPLIWHDGHINAMAVQRENGRIVVVQGDIFLTKLLNNAEYKPLKEGLSSWLLNGRNDVRFMKTSDKFQQNDILVITRDQSFDVENVYGCISSGQNTALIGYKTIEGREKEDDATRLLNRLNIRYKHNDANHGLTVVDLQQFIESSLCLPVACQLQTYIDSWKTFRTERFVNLFSWEDWDSQVTQEVLQQLLRKYHDYMASIAPCKLIPYKSNPKNLIALLNYNDLMQYQQDKYVYALPGVTDTMRNVHSSYARRKNTTVSMNIDVDGNFFPTCCYVRRREQFEWKVLETNVDDLSGMFIRINAMTDNLAELPEMRRWPSMSFIRPLTMEGKMASPHGGPIFLQLPRGTNIKLQFSRVRRHPCVDLRNPDTIKDVSVMFSRNFYVPHAVLMGDAMYSVLQMEFLDDEDKRDLVSTANYFDNCIKIMHNYRGTQYQLARMEVFVTDVQPLNRWGHSGYPLVGTTAWSDHFGKWEAIQQGQFKNIVGLLGRNLRVFPATLKNGAAVISDVYQLVCLKHLLNIPTNGPGDEPLFNQDIVNNMIGIWNQSEYKGLDFGYYAYLHSLFGDGLVGNLFHKAMKNSGQLRTRTPREQFWLHQISVETGYNMLPFHRLWNMPISQDTYNAVKTLPCFMPDDELTRLVPDKVKTILKDKKCAHTGQNKVQFAGDLTEGVNTPRPQSIVLSDYY